MTILKETASDAVSKKEVRSFTTLKGTASEDV